MVCVERGREGAYLYKVERGLSANLHPNRPNTFPYIAKPPERTSVHNFWKGIEPPRKRWARTASIEVRPHLKVRPHLYGLLLA